jgi:hypothetical protein
MKTKLREKENITQFSQEVNIYLFLSNHNYIRLLMRETDLIEERERSQMWEFIPENTFYMPALSQIVLSV